jgi:hypothetical protein
VRGIDLALDGGGAAPPYEPDGVLLWRPARGTLSGTHRGADVFDALLGPSWHSFDRPPPRLPQLLARVAVPEGVFIGAVLPGVEYAEAAAEPGQQLVVHRGCLYTDGGGVSRVSEVYEVLTGAAPGFSLGWAPWHEAHAPPAGAVIVGRTAAGQPLLAGCSAQPQPTGGAVGETAFRVGLAVRGALVAPGSLQVGAPVVAQPGVLVLVALHDAAPRGVPGAATAAPPTATGSTVETT